MPVMNGLERRAVSSTADAARKTQQDRIRNARAAIARDEAALIQAREARDLREASMLTKELANRRTHLAELLGLLPAIDWRHTS